MTQELFLERFGSYPGISSILKECSHQEILTHAAAAGNVGPEVLAQMPMGGYAKGKQNGAYFFVLQDLVKNVQHFDWLYGKLTDSVSRSVFTSLMQYRLLPDRQFLQRAYDGYHPQYFDKSIVCCDENEVFVDCGGFTGDTTEAYIQQYGAYKHIYVYEPSQDNIAVCRKNLEKYDNITVRQYGVGEKSENLTISNSSASSSFLGGPPGEAGEAGDAIPIVSLDEDIQEAVTYIKMDVEGFEIPALLGAKHHIRNDSPKLAICTYHILSDMWEIPRLIDAINPDYQFYMRHYHDTQNWETVVYAIPPRPKAAKMPPQRKRHNILVPPVGPGWYNAQFVKDCGLIPYLLFKNHNCDITFLGAKLEDYSNHETYLKGTNLEILPSGSEAEKLEYIRQHAAEYDGMILYGCYDVYHDIVLQYKELNPLGRVYMALDANSHWMDRIQWDNPYFRGLMDRCDVIAASCLAMQRHLNAKWPWKIEYIPNGYYGFGFDAAKPDFNRKENLILTVGRLGTPQKATNVLLEAFAAIAQQIPDWSLRLVGGIEEEFRPYLEEFQLGHPELKSRIQCAGFVGEREALFQEYRRAKIFALPSTFEGGTPNVISEALNGGCAIAITKIDAYEDAIDGGRTGQAAEINDVAGFAKILLDLCSRTDLPQILEHAYEYGRTQFDMEHIVAKLNDMLFEEGGRCE